MPLSEYKVIRPAAVVADRVLVDLTEKGPTSESEKSTPQTNDESRLNQAGDVDSHGANDRECTAGRRNGLGKANGFRLEDLALTPRVRLPLHLVWDASLHRTSVKEPTFSMGSKVWCERLMRHRDQLRFAVVVNNERLECIVVHQPDHTNGERLACNYLIRATQNDAIGKEVVGLFRFLPLPTGLLHWHTREISANLTFLALPAAIGVPGFFLINEVCPAFA